MRRLGAISLVIGLLFAPAVALAQEANAGFYDLKPVVFVVYDSSGSMSYVQGTNDTPVCTTGVEKDDSLSYSFSRDMIAKEVLTGTFNGFWCRQQERPPARYDYGYPIPWYTPQFSSQGLGIIDTNMERVKFAFMSFDSVLADEADQTGGWSLGPTGAALAGVGVTNLGAVNAAAPFGPLAIPAPADDLLSLQTHNNTVQTAILNTIPYGGTPIAPALQDVSWLLKNHEFLIKKTNTNNGDPYANCRTKNVLLITDGKPTLGEGALGYKTSVAAAESLFKSGAKVHVVGFNLTDGSATAVNEIAAAGGTIQAHLASTQGELATALSSILGKATPGVHSRTRTVTTNITGSATDLQYRISTAYSTAPTTDIDLRGYLEVTSYTCEAGCKDAASGGAGACTLTDARPILQARGTRDMQFVLDGALQPFDPTNQDLTADRLGIPLSGPLPDLTPVLQSGVYQMSGQTLGDASDPSVRSLYRADLIKLLRAEAGTRRQLERLGGIWHSTPVLQTNLSNLNLAIPSLTTYKQSIQNRPTMAYTMTHDGFIHAFHVSQPGTATPSGINWLDEVWAIAPAHTTANMHQVADKLQILGDGVGTLKDIRLLKTSAQLSVADEAKLWRSVLVMPYRQGGRGLIAIDVTDPFNPFVRWEIDNNRHCWLDTTANTTLCRIASDGDAHDYRNLGYTHGKPQIGTVFVTDPDSNQKHEVAAVFYPCGDGVAGEPQSGKCFMVTRLDDGRKIREFRNGNDSVSDNNPAANNVLDTLDFDIVGDPAVYNTFLGTFVTRLFVGDEGGQLWRIDVSSADPSQWKMSFFFDIYYEHAQAGIDYALRGPIQAAPAMSPVPQRGQLALVFGSGDVDSTSSLSQWAIVYSIKEKLLVDPSSGALLPGSVSYEVNWKRQLNEGEFLSSSPIIYNNTAYFTSFQPDSTDACDGGIGRIWGLDFIQSSTGTTPVGKLDGDGDPTTTGDTVEYIELVDSIPTGLSLISRPACSGNQGVDAATSGGGSSAQGGSSALQASKPGVLELVVQTGSSGQTNSASAPATGNATSQVRKFAQPIPRPSPQVISVSWGQIQNL